MEENKYRKLMVTPAFLEARWRKEINEFTYGRVIPTSSRGERTKERGVVQIEKAPKSSPPRLKHQTTQTSINKLENIERSATKNEVQEPGKHLKSWKIPGRILSTSDIKKIPLFPSCLLAQKKSTNDQDEDEATKSGNSRHSSRSTAGKKQSTFPNIVPEERKENMQNRAELLGTMAHEFDKEWLRKFDIEERKIFDAILNQPPDDRCDGNSFKQTIMLKNRKNLSAKSESIIHKTSSVAWRRDSTWLKPIRTTFQSWHGLPTHQFNSDTSNVTALYMRPHKKIDASFVIHPEWGCKA